jgi:predicted nucleic acid-binding protein
LVYLDSSLVLARYLSEPLAAEAEALWKSEEALVASALTVIETVVALRRCEATAGKKKSEWLAATLSQVEADFQLVSILYDMKPPTDLVWKEERLSACRASDALHVASALWLHRDTGRPVLFASFDKRQREVAASCGLQVRPESL